MFPTCFDMWPLKLKRYIHLWAFENGRNLNRTMLFFCYLVMLSRPTGWKPLLWRWKEKVQQRCRRCYLISNCKSCLEHSWPYATVWQYSAFVKGCPTVCWSKVPRPRRVTSAKWSRLVTRHHCGFWTGLSGWGLKVTEPTARVRG